MCDCLVRQLTLASRLTDRTYKKQREREGMKRKCTHETEIFYQSLNSNMEWIDWFILAYVKTHVKHNSNKAILYKFFVLLEFWFDELNAHIEMKSEIEAQWLRLSHENIIIRTYGIYVSIWNFLCRIVQSIYDHVCVLNIVLYNFFLFKFMWICDAHASNAPIFAI